MKDQDEVIYTTTKDGRGIVCFSTSISFAVAPVSGDVASLVVQLNEQQLPAKQYLEEVLNFSLS